MSQRATGKARQQLAQQLASLTAKVPWVFSGDVSVEIEWTVRLKWRYESDRAQDVDNIVKPILDGISGPTGCLIDDTQVNHVSVHWTTWIRPDRQHLKISIRSLDPWVYLPRGFKLVQLNNGYVIPLPHLDDARLRQLLVEATEKQMETFEALQGTGLAWESAQHVLPVQRYFHPNKLSRFQIITADDYQTG